MLCAAQVTDQQFLCVVHILEIVGCFFIRHACFTLLVFVRMVLSGQLSESDSYFSLACIWFQAKYFESRSQRGGCCISPMTVSRGEGGGGDCGVLWL